MIHGTKHLFWLFGAAVFALSAPDMGARADGDDFFGAEEIPGQPVYVIFGSVKDDRGNRLANAVVTVEVQEPVLIYETRTNIIGRFRTVDVGRAVTELGYDVDPALIEVTVSAPGYAPLRQFRRSSPRRTHGAVEIDIVVAKQK